MPMVLVIEAFKPDEFPGNMEIIVDMKSKCNKDEMVVC